MANMRYFNGDRRLTCIQYDGRKASGIPEGAELIRANRVPAERIIEFKSNPSRHACDARCYNATGKIMRCECSCGGKNHGREPIRCAVA